MKKKGFTLIELLAVILILGIIALIAIPTVTKIIETAKKNSLKVSASGVLEAGNYYYATNGKDIEDEIVFTCSGNKCINGDKVVNYSGNVENGILVIKKNGDMGICINSGKYYASKEIETDTIGSGKGYCDSYSEGTFVVSSGSDEDAIYKQRIESLIVNNMFVWEYDYTGNEEELIIPFDGIYKLEVWGAQGGGSGGYGGYSSGMINFIKDDHIYITIGGRGERNSGGYNGGGSGQYQAGSVINSGYGGGGATHIASNSRGVLTNYASYQDEILIVAGGGGGGSEYGYNGGSGGGISGVNGTGECFIPTGGNQSGAGNKGDADCVAAGFGSGGSSPYGTNKAGTYGAGGGGAGFYGGGAGSYRTGDFCGGSGAGGSGYIGNSNLSDKIMYCYNCTESTLENAYTVNTKGTNELVDIVNCQNGYSNNSISKCAKSGNGYAKVTFIDLPKNFKKYKELYKYIVESGIVKWNFDYTGDEQLFNVPVKGKYKIELWGAQGGVSGNAVGGKGAYTSGVINLSKNTNLYVYVGEYISTYQDRYSFNGGGRGSYGSVESKSGNGGGATDVRLVNGMWDNFDSLKSRIMVAAGGGGATYWCEYLDGGAGGILEGISGNKYTAPNGAELFISIGGSQTSGGLGASISSNRLGRVLNGKFGIGGKSSKYTDEYVYMAGGGGGYYGGGAGSSGDLVVGSAAGGSSYVSGYDGCKAIEEDSTEDNIVHKNNSIHYSNYVFGNIVMIDGNSQMPSPYNSSTIIGNTGYGHARITLISIN